MPLTAPDRQGGGLGLAAAVLVYVVAPVMVAAAAGLAWVMSPGGLEPTGVILLLGAVAVSAWRGGFGPGFIAAVAAAASLWGLSSGVLDLAQWADEHTGPALLLLLGIATTFMLSGSGRRGRHGGSGRGAGDQASVEGLLDALAAFVAVLERDGRILEANDPLLRCCGAAGQELRGCRLEDCPCWAASERTRHRIRGAVARAARGEFSRFDVPFTTPDGTSGTLDITIKPLRAGEGGLPRRLIVYGVDVTGRRRAEEALRESETLLRSFSESSPVLMGVVELAGDAILHIYDNPATLRFFGAPEETRGRSSSELGAPAEAVKLWVERYREAERSGRPVHFEYEHRLPDDASGAPRSCWLSATVSAIGQGPSGRPRFCYVAEDATLRRRVAEAVQRSEARFRAIFDSDIVPMYFWHADGRISAANDAFLRLIGASRADLLAGRIRWDRITPAEYLAANRAAMEQCRRNGRCPPFEQEYLLADGRRVPVLIGRAELQGVTDGGVGFALDLTVQKQATQQLASSEERLRIASEAGRIGIWEWDVGTDRVVWSDLLYRIHGVDPASFGNRAEDFFALVHPDDQPRLKGALQQALAGEGEYAVEFRCLRPDGGCGWLWTRATILRDNQGRAIRLVGATLDMTERRRAEEALRESETRLRLALDAARLATWEVDLLTGRVSDSPAFAAMIDLPPCPPEGRGGREWIRRIHPDDRRRVQREFGDAVAGVAPYATDHRILLSDGQVRWLAVSGAILRDQAGRPVRSIGVASDITERREAENALRDSEERFRSIFNHAGAGIMVATPEGVIREVNDRFCEILGYGRDELVGASNELFSHPEDMPPTREAVQVLLAGESSSVTLEKRYIRKNGSVAWISATASLVRDAAGAPRHMLGVVQDITQRRLAEMELARHRENLEQLVQDRSAQLAVSQQRLRLAERMAAIGTLSAGLGHDMGNLLLPIRLRLDSLQDQAGTPEMLADLEAVRTATGYLQRLANGLRLLALDPAQRGPDQVTDLREWWGDVAPLLRNVLPRSVLLQEAIPEGLPHVLAGRHQLTQAVFNLVQNAGDALRERGRGRVRVWADVAGRMVRIGVTDDGPGMTPEVRARCIEPFFSTKTRAISTGLGLTLVHGIAAHCGGELQVESQPGRGATFALVLPAEPVPARGLAAEFSAESVAVVSLTDPRMRSLAATLLVTCGFRIVESGGAGQVPAEARVLLTDDRTQAAAAVVDFLERSPGNWLVVVGEDLINPSAWCSPAASRIIRLGNPPRPSDLRSAILRLTRACAGHEAPDHHAERPDDEARFHQSAVRG